MKYQYSPIAFLMAAIFMNVAQASGLPVTRNDYGEVGLLQMPTARFGEEGDFGVSFSRVAPYNRISVFAQPFPWLDVGFRYTDIANRFYGPRALSGDQSYKDKSIDFKLRLLQESRGRPEIALGIRDMGGTGLFSSEYFVASKRWERFDFSGGIAWGNMAQRGNTRNPFTYLSGRFDNRVINVEQGGEFSADSYFSGISSLFGGIEYSFASLPLSVKVEYDSNSYQNEPLGNQFEVRSPINFGMTYRWKNVLLSLGYERGNTAMFGVNLNTNLQKDFSIPKTNPDPLPVSVATQNTMDWEQTKKELKENAGLNVSRIIQRGATLLVEAEPTIFRETPKSDLRAAAILERAPINGVKSYTIMEQRQGVVVAERRINRLAFQQAAAGDIGLNELQKKISNRDYVTNLDKAKPADVLVSGADDKRFKYALYPKLTQNIGGPDNFLLFQLGANADFAYKLSSQTLLQSTFSLGIIDNFEKFRFDGFSALPHVRTDLRRYLTTSNFKMTNMHINHFERISNNGFALVYGGYLEAMFAGAGVEYLYRQPDSNLALGLDLNYVAQRGFAQDFSLRDYRILTGHLTAYQKINDGRILAKYSIGRYLAGDYGGTIDLSRQFDNGVQMGAYATKTNVSAKTFGEGSFDKGLYLVIPFDAFFTRASRGSTAVYWSPLTRDGGQKLARPKSLYDMTRGHDYQAYQRSFGKALD